MYIVGLLCYLDNLDNYKLDSGLSDNLLKYPNKTKIAETAREIYVRLFLHEDNQRNSEIMALGGVLISPTLEVRFLGKTEACMVSLRQATDVNICSMEIMT